MTDAEPKHPLFRLIEVMARLRDPDGGCPWDLEQSFATIAPYTIEEAYEVADAIERGDMADLKEELGDLLLQVVYHARMAEEDGAFDFAEVAAAVADKMIRRHPHVFGADEVKDAAAQTARWEAIKAAERAAKGVTQGALEGVPLALPALTRARKLGGRAARVGFDHPDMDAVIAKLQEELGELQAEIDAGDMQKAREEMGDLLFACADLARKLDVEPEDALRATNAKFARRFGYVESRLAEQGRKPEESDLAEMEALWNEVRAKDKAG